MKTGNFPAGLVNEVILSSVFTVEEVFKTNISMMPFGEGSPLSFGSLRKKKAM